MYVCMYVYLMDFLRRFDVCRSDLRAFREKPKGTAENVDSHGDRPVFGDDCCRIREGYIPVLCVIH